MKIPSSASMGGLDVNADCRVWTIDGLGDNARMTNRSKVYQLVAQSINHVAGRTPRILYGQAFDNATVAPLNSHPCFEMQWLDNVVNERSRTVRVLSLPRDSDTHDMNVAANCWTNAAGSTSIASFAGNPTPTWPSDIAIDSISVGRGASSNALYTEAISIMNGLPVVDIVAQTDPRPTLDSDLGDDMALDVTSPGLFIVSAPVEAYRETFHRLRMGHNRTVVCFLGVTESNARGQLTGTNASTKGFWTNSDTFVNVLDQSITSRTASSPGVTCPGYKGGVGQSNGLGVQFYVLGSRGVDNGVGYVKIIGPDHRANNDTTIAIDWDHTAPEWATNATPVYLNTEVDYDDATTARNKLDIQIAATNAGEEVNLYTVLGVTRQA